MATQRYVYETHETETRHQSLTAIGSTINEYANEGWRLVDTLERDGTTMGLIFERRVDD